MGEKYQVVNKIPMAVPPIHNNNKGSMIVIKYIDTIKLTKMDMIVVTLFSKNVIKDFIKVNLPFTLDESTPLSICALVSLTANLR